VAIRNLFPSNQPLEVIVTVSPSGGKFFLCGQKELDRKNRIGEALKIVAPALEPPAPMYPSRRAVWQPQFRTMSFSGDLLKTTAVIASPKGVAIRIPLLHRTHQTTP